MFAWGDNTDGRLGLQIEKGFYLNRFEVFPQRVLRVDYNLIFRSNSLKRSVLFQPLAEFLIHVSLQIKEKYLPGESPNQIIFADTKSLTSNLYYNLFIIFEYLGVLHPRSLDGIPKRECQERAVLYKGGLWAYP